MRYNGVRITGADIGNFHYAYVARAAGFDEDTTIIAAGIYQIHSGTSRKCWRNNTFYGDDPMDQAFIKTGIAKYSQDNGGKYIFRKYAYLKKINFKNIMVKPCKIFILILKQYE